MRGRRLVAAMGHAVRALLVAAGAVEVPVGRLDQLLEALRIALAEQITGLLPAEDVARRHAPGRAMVALVAGQEVEEEAGMHELPALALAEREDLAEKLLGLAPVEEMRLVGCALVGVAGRDRDADAELLGEIEKGRDVLRRMAGEGRAGDVDGEALGLGGLDGVDRLLEPAFHAHRLVVMMLDAVEMHRE